MINIKSRRRTLEGLLIIGLFLGAVIGLSILINQTDLFSPVVIHN